MKRRDQGCTEKLTANIEINRLWPFAFGLRHFGVLWQFKSVAFWLLISHEVFAFEHRKRKFDYSIMTRKSVSTRGRHCQLFRRDANFSLASCVFFPIIFFPGLPLAKAEPHKKAKNSIFYFICCRNWHLHWCSRFDVDSTCARFFRSSANLFDRKFSTDSIKGQSTKKSLIISWVRHDAYVHVLNSPENSNSIRMEFKFAIGFCSSLL